MVPGSAKKMMRGFSFKPKNKKTKEGLGVGAESSTTETVSEFFISEENEDKGGLLSAEEREKLYASVAAKHEEVALISGTDIWMKV